MADTNHVKKVAIVGVNGTVGKYITKALLSGGKHEVTAVTRGDAEIPKGVKVAKVSYDDPASLTKALEGQDVLIITMGTRAPKDTQQKLVEAAAAANVAFVFPNAWGIESSYGALGTDTLLGPPAIAAMRRAEELGKSAWIMMNTGYWYSHSLATSSAHGFDLNNKTVTFYDEGTTKINNITWEKTGDAVRNLLSLPIEPEGGNGPTLSDYRNKQVYISGWLLSQKDIFQHVLRVSGTMESDWTIKYEPAAQRYEEAKKRLFSGDRSAYNQMLYARTYYNNGDGNFETRHVLENEKLGLAPETPESLDEQTKLAFELAASGYKY
ncbi:putative oxidoreductase CipA [Xylaria bambusicola]|uniref:putative oxidoreductase CipA n=1 Tax=Xylaria bambusicola TaxID=326684 RepID=UPI002008492C|nr:putative oxidoreductase CipA [Xylaria bambusicola]KAI0517405.1 putative oxidoreductase CipA [Xylaria bambusicola]